jgi:hypothetical protein
MNRTLVVRLGIEACSPNRHVARTVGFDLVTAVYEAGDLVHGQWIPETL